MKKIISAILFLLFNTYVFCQVVNIPDANFKNYLLNNTSINTNGDDEIQVAEAAAFAGNLYVSSLNIFDLTGIETFINIRRLYCDHNQLTVLNVSNNTLLIELLCHNNLLTSLVVSSNTGLTLLSCDNNQILSLDVSNNTILTKLWCGNNYLTTLVISNNAALTELLCSHNQLTSLDASNKNVLTRLECSNNQLESINVTNSTALTILTCGNNPQMHSLDVSTNTALTYLNLSCNHVTGLNVSANTELISLDCRNNQLYNLDVSANTVLRYLDCYNTFLMSLNVKNGNNSNFTFFYSRWNPNLSCIEVDDAAWANTNWRDSIWGADPTSSFSEDCHIGINEQNNSPILIYPNPASTTLTINAEFRIKYVELKIFNAQGQLALQSSIINQKSTIDISALSPGIYIISIFDGERQVNGKFVKK